ncbi:uncharacterized protein LOC123988482 [Osmia bicornis bicornis]|uniref:uncharacterized protein LOC123988482 n=1 Tax=Osmia bicornis bicornis TaxID=1437191 RepID=UPI001EAF16C8|nr:uncharacterized protein LOC123988482 [Osmia bicornis bicornis]
MTEWTQDKVLQMIEMYRNRSNLWDCRDKTYKDRNKRHDALTEIAVCFGESKEEIDRKIKSLLSHFSRELKREEKSLKSGASTDEVPIQVEVVNNSSKEKICNDVFQEECSTSAVSIVEEQSAEKTPENATYALSTNKISTRKKKADNEVKEAYNIMKEMYRNRSPRDEYTLLGEQVAIKVRQLPSAHARIMVQHIINTTLFEAKLGEYDNPPI